MHDPADHHSPYFLTIRNPTDTTHPCYQGTTRAPGTTVTNAEWYQEHTVFERLDAIEWRLDRLEGEPDPTRTRIEPTRCVEGIIRVDTFEPDSEMDEPFLPVWACAHLWERLEKRDVDAGNRIASAAHEFMSDCGENVALCDDCRSLQTDIPMTKRNVQSDFPPGEGNIMAVFAWRNPVND